MRHRNAITGEAEITTLAATAVAVLGAVFVAGNTADFLMAEVQFWMFAVFVTMQQLFAAGVAELSDSTGTHAAGMSQRARSVEAG